MTATAHGTTTTDRPAAAPRGPSRTPLRRRVAQWRWPLLVALLVLVSASIGLVLLRPTNLDRLDPGNAGPDGTRALVHVLDDHGVVVQQRSRGDEVLDHVERVGGRATVVVARTDLLTASTTDQLRRLLTTTGAQVVLVEAQQSELADLDLPVSAAATASPTTLVPGCDEPVARRAGDVLAGTTAYRSGSATSACYSTDDGATYLILETEGGGRVTLLGSGDALTNDRLADHGDAALAVGVLGQQPVLVWWTPTVGTSAPGSGTTSLTDLLPRQVGWVVAQLAVALLVVVLWRGRRLGRLVTEPLPVVVRSVETTLGRAALYRRARARGRAAAVLRAAAGRRVAVRHGLPRTAPPEVVAAVVAEHSDRPASELSALLAGPAPRDDRELVALARDLDSLESALSREVPRP
ncbi:MAG TPA: DUF4350 domain-containing protein [Actinomycetales bacterium]|nr:DUF4350 domain-containing protein [Actinomycetales bacterium]